MANSSGSTSAPARARRRPSPRAYSTTAARAPAACARPTTSRRSSRRAISRISSNLAQWRNPRSRASTSASTSRATGSSPSWTSAWTRTRPRDASTSSRRSSHSPGTQSGSRDGEFLFKSLISSFFLLSYGQSDLRRIFFLTLPGLASPSTPTTTAGTFARSGVSNPSPRSCSWRTGRSWTSTPDPTDSSS